MIKRFMDNLCVRVRKLEEKIKNIKPIEPASASELGGVKVLPNSGIHIESDGAISVANATSSSAGIVQAGDGLTVVAGGKLNVKTGTGLSIGDDGSLNASGGKLYWHHLRKQSNDAWGGTMAFYYDFISSNPNPLKSLAELSFLPDTIKLNTASTGISTTKCEITFVNALTRSASSFTLEVYGLKYDFDNNTWTTTNRTQRQFSAFDSDTVKEVV